MLRFREAYLGNRGFTLMEVLLASSLIPILILSLCSLLFFTENLTSKGEEIDLALCNARYAMEFIKGEFSSADRILPSSSFNKLDLLLPTNIGFVMMEEEISYNSDGTIRKINYNYRTYYQKNDELVRGAYNSGNKSLYEGTLFSGHNQICDGLLNISVSRLDGEGNLLALSLDFIQADGPLELETIISLRCPVE